MFFNIATARTGTNVRTLVFNAVLLARNQFAPLLSSPLLSSPLLSSPLLSSLLFSSLLFSSLLFSSLPTKFYCRRR
jgi:hypothetical protein